MISTENEDKDDQDKYCDSYKMTNGYSMTKIMMEIGSRLLQMKQQNQHPLNSKLVNFLHFKNP